jgi:hypothetical protein
LKNPQKQKDCWIEKKPAHLFYWKEEKALSHLQLEELKDVLFLSFCLDLLNFLLAHLFFIS